MIDYYMRDLKRKIARAAMAKLKEDWEIMKKLFDIKTEE